MGKKLLFIISMVLLSFRFASRVDAQQLCGEIVAQYQPPHLTRFHPMPVPLAAPVLADTKFKISFTKLDGLAQHLENTIPEEQLGGKLIAEFPDDKKLGWICDDQDVMGPFNTRDDFKSVASRVINIEFETSEGQLNFLKCGNLLTSANSVNTVTPHRIRLRYSKSDTPLCQYILRTQLKPAQCQVQVKTTDGRNWGTVADIFEVTVSEPVLVHPGYDFLVLVYDDKITTQDLLYSPAPLLKKFKGSRTIGLPIDISKTILLDPEGKTIPSGQQSQEHEVKVYAYDRKFTWFLGLADLELVGDLWKRGFGAVCGSASYQVLTMSAPTPTPLPTPNEDCQRCMITARNPCECIPCLPAYPECQPTSGPPVIRAKKICEQIEARCKTIPCNYISGDNREECIKEKKQCSDLPLSDQDRTKCIKEKQQCDKDVNSCKTCFEQGGAWTALGCIKTDVGGFVRDLFRIILGVVGGIAFLFLLKGGYQIMFSRGDAEQIAEGRQTITAAVAGIVFIFLAVFILKLIGVTILDLPGFGPKPTAAPTPTPQVQCEKEGGECMFPHECTNAGRTWTPGRERGCNDPSTGNVNYICCEQP